MPEIKKINIAEGTTVSSPAPLTVTIGDIMLEELGSDPATPAAGRKTLYAKTDGNLYTKDDAGTVVG